MRVLPSLGEKMEAVENLAEVRHDVKKTQRKVNRIKKRIILPVLVLLTGIFNVHRERSRLLASNRNIFCRKHAEGTDMEGGYKAVHGRVRPSAVLVACIYCIKTGICILTAHKKCQKRRRFADSLFSFPLSSGPTISTVCIGSMLFLSFVCK